MDRDPRRPPVTQRTIAELAGVSQTTVSLVLNGKADAQRRIPPATRDRVLAAISASDYVVKPAVRRRAVGRSALIGVVASDAALPISATDHGAAMLSGIESASSAAGADLLMLTGSPVVDGRRRVFHESSRLRLADGCLLLGRTDPKDLARLEAGRIPAVSLTHRTATVAGTPFVGADHRTASAALAARALLAGHRRFGLLHRSSEAESNPDLWAGVADGVGAGGVLIEVEVMRGDVLSAWKHLRLARPTVVLVEDPLDALDLCDLLDGEGLRVPQDVSVIALGDHARLLRRGPDLTRMRAPVSAVGARAVEVLLDSMRGTADPEPQELLPCSLVLGTTLAPPAPAASRARAGAQGRRA